MHDVKLVWITPDAEKLIAYMARVSNPANQKQQDHAKIIKYMIKNGHWSPFEMVSACFEITCPRDIARQILRHRSFSFQEFSQRYQTVEQLPPAVIREARLQDTKNRQNSLDTDDPFIQDWWKWNQEELLQLALDVYKTAIENGIAKEVARAVLPEGLTTSRMYMSGTLRSWMHYCQLRTDVATQKEHRLIANEISEVLERELPDTWSILGEKNDAV